MDQHSCLKKSVYETTHLLLQRNQESIKSWSETAWDLPVNNRNTAHLLLREPLIIYFRYKQCLDVTVIRYTWLHLGWNISNAINKAVSWLSVKKLWIQTRHIQIYHVMKSVTQVKHLPDANVEIKMHLSGYRKALELKSDWLHICYFLFAPPQKNWGSQ